MIAEGSDKNNQLRGDLDQLNLKYKTVNSEEETVEKVNMNIKKYDSIDIIIIDANFALENVSLVLKNLQDKIKDMQMPII